MKQHELPPQLLEEIAKTNFGSVYTSPLQSAIIRWAIGLLITVVGTRVFKAELGGEQVAMWVEFTMALLACGMIIVHRLRSGTPIKTLEQAAQDLLPVLDQAATPEVRNDLLNVVKSANPKLHATVVALMK